MYVYHSLDEVPDPEGMSVTLTMGFFDGVHLGHRRILDQVGNYFSTGVQATGLVTFDQHPAELLAPDKAPKLLTTLHEKIALLSAYKLTYVLALPFDRNLASMSASDFVQEILVDRLRISQMIVGYDTRFGRGAEGDSKLLEQIGQAWHFKTKTVDAVKFGDKPVSSTMIRTLIEKGNLPAAEKMLGRRYTLEGKVVKGIGLGRKMGIPTANVQPEAGKLVPPNGIYAGWINTPDGRKKTAINIGLRPTIPLEKPVRTIEAHIIDFDGDLYGSDLTIEFVRFIRPEKKFDNVKLLIEQIRKDIELAKILVTN